MDAALVGMLLQSWQDGAVDDEIFSEQLADIAAAGKLRKNQILLTLRQRRAWDAPSLTTALDSLIASTTLSSSGDSELLSDDFRRQENAWFNDRNPTSAEEERRDVHAAAQFEADAAYARRIATEGADAAYAQRIANESARADAVAEAERLEQQAADAALAQRMSSQIIIDDLASEAGAVGAAGGVGDAGGGAFPTPPKGLHSSRAASGAGPFRPRMVRMPSTQQDEELDRAWGHSGSAGYDGGGSSSSSSSSSRRTSSRNRSLDDEARRILLEIESTGAAIESGGGAEGAEPFHFIDPDFQPGSEGCGMPDPRAEVHHAMDHDFGSAGGASPPPLEWSRPERVEYDAGSGSLQQKYASLKGEGSSGGLFLPFGARLQGSVGNLFSSSARPGSSSSGNAGEVSELVARNRLRVKGSAESIWKLFDGPPSAEDVQQGRLGDCWFLSALSVLAEYDGGRLVQRLFPGDQTEGFSLGGGSSSSRGGNGGGNGGGGNGRSVVVPASRYGAYVVRLCRGGDWENVVVDDSFPTNPTEGGKYLRQFAFARTRGCRLWVPLVEKAYAKLCRGYRHIIGGQTAEALHVLTGWPCEQYRLSGSEKHGSEPAPSPSSRRTADNNKDDDGLPDSGSSAAERAVDVDDLWAKLLSSSEAGYIICTSTGTDVARCESVGLVPNHAYAVTRVCEVTEPFSGRRERLLRLRNPHGSTNGWKGAWHHGDTQRWTPELRVSCDVDDGGGGGSSSSFWIALADAVRYFDQCTVCRVRKNWAEARGLGCFMPPRIIAASQRETAAASNAWEQRPSSGCSASTRSASSWADGGAEFDAWQVQAFARSEVVIDISQPAPRVSASGLCDLAVAVLRLSGSGGGGSENGVDIRDARLHATCPSRIAPTICCETWFEEGARYVIVPLAFNHAPTRARRPFSVAVLSSQGVTLDKYRLSPAASRQVVCAYACSPGAAKTRLWHGIQVSSRGDGCTLFVHVRNGNQGGQQQQQLPQSLGDVFGLGGTDHAFGGNFGNLLAGNSGTGLHFELMLKNMINMTHSRGTNSSFSVSGEGEFATIDDVPPGHSMLIAIVAPVAETYGYASATRYSTRPRMSSLDSSSSPSAVVDSIHALHPSPGV